MIGKRFHFLVVQKELERVKYATTFSRRYLCLCDCGNTVVALPSNLNRGATKSCGCWKRMTAGLGSKTHGMSRTPEYFIWAGMRKRCLKPAYREYHLYGGRGITISPRWDTFANFMADMGPRPSDQHSLDRKDSNGNYEPSNCRWATDIEQSNNTSRNVLVTYLGEAMTVSEFARRIDRPYFSVYHLVARKKLSAEEAVSRLVPR
jgi:hypothetical protein